jgi:hypothetical protein
VSFNPFDGQVILYCEARVGGERVYVQQAVAQIVYDDPEAREHIRKALRQALMLSILEKWTPVVRVRR